MGTTLSAGQEAIVLHIRKTCLLPLDDLLNITQRFINVKASRSGISRLLRRQGMAKLSDLQPVEPGQDKPKKSFNDCVPGFVQIDIKYLPQMPHETSRRLSARGY